MSTISPTNPKANRYTDEEKREAVAIMQELGGLTYEAIQAIRNIPKFSVVSRAILGRWQKEMRGNIAPRAIEIIQQSPEAQHAVRNMQDKRLEAYTLMLDRMSDPDFIKAQNNLNHLGVTWGILEERMRLSIGISTEIVNLCKRFVAVVTRKGFDPVKAFEDVIESYEQEPDAR